MKKIISLILSVSLILGTVITASLLNTSAYTKDTNIFSNGEFETQTSLGCSYINSAASEQSYIDGEWDCDNWYRSGYAGSTDPYSTDQYKSGTHSFEMNCSSSSNPNGFYKNFKVEKNTKYTVSFWYYVSSFSGTSIQAGINTTEALNNPESNCIIGLNTADTYTLYKGSDNQNTWLQMIKTFDSGENDVLRLLFRFKQASGTIYLDDVVVKKLVTATFNNNNGTEGDEETLTGVPGTTMNPTEPTMEGYEFGGWYTDTEYTTEAPTTYPKTNTTYYAKWVSTSPVTACDEYGLLAAGADNENKTGITLKENSAIYIENDVEYTAFRVYGEYKCPVVDGAADPTQIIIDENGTAKYIANRNIYAGIPAVTDITEIYEIKSTSANLKNVWSCTLNDDGTYTVRFSLLLKKLDKNKAKTYDYEFNSTVTYYNNGTEGDTTTVKGIEQGGATLTAQNLYDSAKEQNAELGWFSEED